MQKITDLKLNPENQSKIEKLDRLQELVTVELSERQNIENFGNLLNFMGSSNN